jgi:hypothetical protein
MGSKLLGQRNDGAVAQAHPAEWGGLASKSASSPASFKSSKSVRQALRKATAAAEKRSSNDCLLKHTPAFSCSNVQSWVKTFRAGAVGAEQA